MSDMASALIAPGAIVAGKYRLESIVGEGGMGSVWSATHTGLGQAVAIKFISKEFVTSADALRRFDAEAKAAAQLRSRHVVQVFDNGTLEDGTPYIAMELLRGENVYTRVHRAGPVPIAEAVEILLQSCKALGRAHAAGIVHRDIKPDNIFLAQSTDDEAVLVKILDFGIAKFSAGPNDHGATRTGAVLGTPLYMSPEQARGLKTIDHRTDIYSLGLVAYTMFTGNLAFSSESFGDLLLQICTSPLPSLCANAPWLPPTMEAWFQRACAREPKDRFASAQEFADALKGACGSALGARPPPNLPDLANSGIGLHGASASAVQAVSVGTDAAMSRSGESAVALPRSHSALVAVAVLVLVGCVGIAALVMMSRRAHVIDQPPPVAAASSIAPAPAVASSLSVPNVLAPATSATGSAPVRTAPPIGSHEDTAHPSDVPPHVPSQAHAVSAPTAPPPRGNSSPTNAPTGSKPIDLGY